MTTKSKKRIREEKEIEKQILQLAGLDVKDTFLVDQDTMEEVELNGKLVRYNGDNLTCPTHRNESLFNPLQNRKQTADIFKIFLSKEEEYEGFDCRTYYDKPGKEQNKMAIEMKTSDGKLVSGYYFNESLRYIDLMMQISGSDIGIDISKFDEEIKK